MSKSLNDPWYVKKGYQDPELTIPLVKNDKRDLTKIMNATTFIMEVAEELDYEYQDMLKQCLDELDTLALNELEEA